MQHRMNRPVSILLVGLALASGATACGGKQRGESARWWSTAADLVPNDASWAFFSTPGDREVAELMHMQGSWSLAAGNPMIDELTAATGINFASPTLFDDLGIDPGGQSAIFSTALLPVFVLDLADEVAFNETIERVLDANPDATVTDVEYDGHPFRRVTIDMMHVDFGTIAGWAFVRVGAGQEATDVPDARFEDILAGRVGGRLIDGPEATALAARVAAGSSVTSLGVARSAPIAEGIEALLLSLDDNRSELGAMGISSMATRYRSPEEQQACEAAAERLVTSIPWTGFVGARDLADPDLVRSEMVMHLSLAAAERAGAAVQPIGPAIAAEGSDAAMFMAAGFNIVELLNQNTADSSLMRCPNAGAIAGLLAELKGEISEDDLAMVTGRTDGTFAFGLWDVRFAGFLPFVDAAASMGSPNPLLVAEPLQRQIEQSGGQGTTDTTAAMTTVNYDLMHLDLTMMISETDMAIGVGDVPQRTLNAMMEGGEAVAGGDFAIYRIWGPRLAEIVSNGMEWAKNNGMLTPELDTTFQQLIATYSRIESIVMTGRVEPSDVVLRLEMRQGAPPVP